MKETQSNHGYQHYRQSLRLLKTLHLEANPWKLHTIPGMRIDFRGNNTPNRRNATSNTQNGYYYSDLPGLEFKTVETLESPDFCYLVFGWDRFLVDVRAPKEY